jgi:hypothetical protein
MQVCLKLLAMANVVSSSVSGKFWVLIFLNFHWISIDKDYKKFNISPILRLNINKIASLKSYVLRAFQQYRKHLDFPQKINLQFIEFSMTEWYNIQ